MGVRQGPLPLSSLARSSEGSRPLQWVAKGSMSLAQASAAPLLLLPSPLLPPPPSTATEPLRQQC